jgi:hypothetical protein
MKEVVRDALALAPDTPVVARARARIDALLVELG